MSINNLIREQLFWFLDSLKGSPVKKHYNNIKNIHNDKGSINSESLNKLLLHCVETVPYYKETIVKKSTYTLEDFEVINKNLIRNDYDRFKSSLFLNKKNTQVSTGGSTGTPFKFYHNQDKRNRHLADNIFYAEKGGYRLGDRLYLIRAWHKKNSIFSFITQKRNMKLYGIINYSDKDIQSMLDFMKNDPSIKCIVCFASMCDILVNYLNNVEKKPLDNLNIKSIITDGDSLSKYTKDKMETYFKTPTVARYGNMECGIMGQQPYSGGHHYELNWASYHFEVLNLDNDLPAKPGEVGRIVVTDLFNYFIPLVRYDTGDLASYKIVDGEKVFDRIEGRKVDLIYNTKGDVISPYTVVQKMSEYFELKQFQFVQNDKKKYTFKLNPWSDFTKEKELLLDSKSYLGEDADVSIVYVKEIPLLSSGKRKQVVNEMDE